MVAADAYSFESRVFVKIKINVGCFLNAFIHLSGTKWLSLLLAVVLWASSAAIAQQPALPVWQGFLRNAGGAPVPGAKVRLTANGGSHG